jgi:lipoate-protein ligase A
MKYIDVTLSSPAENLACDEALAEWCDTQGLPVLRFWESPSYFVVLGYANVCELEVYRSNCERDGIPILRRASGGGTVLQGPGCLNYALAWPVSSGSPLQSITATNAFVMSRLEAALQPIVKDTVRIQGYTDLTSGNRKVSGNAQRRFRHSFLFHGTLLYRFDLGLLDKYLRFPPRHPAYRKERSHLDFVANLALIDTQLKAALRQAWQADAEFPNLPLERIQELRHQKYDCAAWNLKL